MAIDKILGNGDLDKIADSVFSAVNDSVSEIKAMQKRKAAENVQIVIQALKKIESELQDKYDGVTTVIEKRVASIKDGQDGRNGVNGKDGKDGRPGRDGATGPRGADGLNGRNGIDGEDGVSVTNAKIDFDGSLVIALSSGREINVGEVVAPELAERIKVITNGGGTSQGVLDTLTSLQNQINVLTGLGAVNYVGTWNASTNTPTLVAGTGDKGDYYVVSVAGGTSIDGQTLWGVGDWIIFNGTAWQKVDGGSTGDFTTLSASGAVTLSGGTANGVTYLNGSKVLTSGSALTFDGAKFVNSSGTSGAIIQSTDTGTTGSFLRMLGDASSGNLINWTTGTALRFATSADNFGSFAEAMRLTSTGLGIGTSSPAYKLDVTGTANTFISVGTTGASSGRAVLYLDKKATPTKYNWLTGAQYNVDNAFEITPSTAAGGTTFSTPSLVINSAGNVGIGTSSPAAKLEVASSGSASTVILRNSGTTSGTYSEILFAPFTGTTAASASIRNLYFQNNASELTFSTTSVNAAPTEKMRIDASGILLVGVTNTNFPNPGFYVSPSGFSKIGNNAQASGWTFFEFGRSGSGIGSITQSGTTAVLYNTTSDQRLKENITDAASASSLIDSLQVRQYDWKADGTHQRYGFVAQELVTVAPEAVHQPEDPEAMMAVDYSKLVPMLVKEIQSLRQRLAALEAAGIA